MAPRPKLFLKKKRRTGSSSSSARNRAIAAFNQKVSQANTLIDQGRLSEANKVISGTNAPAVQARILEEQRLLDARRAQDLAEATQARETRAIQQIQIEKRQTALQRTALKLQEERERLRAERSDRRSLRNLRVRSDIFGSAVGQRLINSAVAGELISKGLYNLRKREARVKFVKDVKAFGRRESQKLSALKDPKVRAFVKAGLNKKINDAVAFAKGNPTETAGIVGGEVVLLATGGKILDTIGDILGLGARGIRKTVNIDLGNVKKLNVLPRPNRPKPNPANDILDRIDAYSDRKVDALIQRSEKAGGPRLTDKQILAVKNKFISVFIPTLRNIGLNPDILRTITRKKLAQKKLGRFTFQKEKLRKAESRIKETALAKAKSKKQDREFTKELERARSTRQKARKRGQRLSLQSAKYDEAIVLIVRTVDSVAKVRAVKALLSGIKKGVNVSRKQANFFIKEYRKTAARLLRERPEFKELVKLSKLSRTDQLKIIRLNRSKSAKSLYNKLSNVVNSLIKELKVTREFRIVKAGVLKLKARLQKKVKKTVAKRKGRLERERVSARRKAGVKRRTKERRKALVQFKKTIKYRMLGKRRIREVTVDQLRSGQFRSNVKMIVDTFFKQVEKKQLINIPRAKYLKMKSEFRKRALKAARTGNVKELENLRNAMLKVLIESKKKRPDVVVEIPKSALPKLPKSVKPKRTFKTLKDFETETPKGTFQEVRVGDQVMLQRVKTVTKEKQRKATVTARVVSVQKQRVNLKSLSQFLATATLSASRLASKTKTTTLQRSAQKSRTKLKAAQATDTTTDTASRLGSAQRTRTATKTRSALRSAQKSKATKKVKAAFGFRQPKEVKTLKKGVQSYFVVVKKRGKLVKLLPRALTLTDAKDYLAYNLDNTLSRTAFYVPAGKRKKVLKLPRDITGSFDKTRKKLRPHKIKQGKKKRLVQGFIEKRRFLLDTAGERRQIRRARKPMTAARRKQLLSQLKKARRVRRRKK